MTPVQRGVVYGEGRDEGGLWPQYRHAQVHTHRVGKKQTNPVKRTLKVAKTNNGEKPFRNPSTLESRRERLGCDVNY